MSSKYVSADPVVVCSHPKEKANKRYEHCAIGGQIGKKRIKRREDIKAYVRESRGINLL